MTETKTNVASTQAVAPTETPREPAVTTRRRRSGKKSGMAVAGTAVIRFPKLVAAIEERMAAIENHRAVFAAIEEAEEAAEERAIKADDALYANLALVGDAVVIWRGMAFFQEGAHKAWPAPKAVILLDD